MQDITGNLVGDLAPDLAWNLTTEPYRESGARYYNRTLQGTLRQILRGSLQQKNRSLQGPCE